MSLELLSFALALVVGGLCFFVVKHTTDEFDRWYDQPRPVIALHMPVIAVSLVAVAAVIVMIAR